MTSTIRTVATSVIYSIKNVKVSLLSMPIQDLRCLAEMA
jgi:hypothetical protein